jgi:hypothetical protein
MVAGVTEAQDPSAPGWWRNPWMWGFILGAVILPWFRPWLSRIPDPPPHLGEHLSGECGEDGAGVRAVVVCGDGDDACDPDMHTNALKAYWITRQNDVVVDWYTLGPIAGTKAASVSAGVSFPSCGSEVVAAEGALGTQQMIQHPLQHVPDGVLGGSILLVDNSGEIRGVMNPAQPLGRRELVSRLAWLLSESHRRD